MRLEAPRVPEYWTSEEISERPQPSMTALQRFVQDNEPVGLEAETEFRKGLQAVIDEVWSLASLPTGDAGEPVAWMRKHPDGTWADDLLPNWQIEQVRRESGAWQPLYATPPTGADALDARWHPIETAPEDGTKFLAFRRGRVADAYRVQRDDCEMWAFGGESGAIEHFPQVKPTHWMPLPAPPAIASTEGEKAHD